MINWSFLASSCLKSLADQRWTDLHSLLQKSQLLAETFELLKEDKRRKATVSGGCGMMERKHRCLPGSASHCAGI